MEDQVTQSPISAQNQTTATPALEQTVAHADNNNNTEVDVMDSALDSLGSKKRRGRPRKYDVNENLLSPATTSSVPSGLSSYPFGSSVKRSRGRPRGSGKLQLLASLGGFVAETAGGSFTPHVLTVNTGEDVFSRILSFSQRGPRAVCILSATGTVSSVIIRQPGSSEGILRYEGRFEILSLSGSYTYAGVGRKNGMLSVSLAKPDGRVFGGGVEGSLIAAGPIQLIMGTFKANISGEIKRRYSAVSSTAANMSADNPDSVKAPLEVPKMTEGEQSCPSPTCGLVLPTTNGLPDNVIPANQNMHSASAVNGVGLDRQSLQQPITDQRTSSADVDTSVTQI